MTSISEVRIEVVVDGSRKTATFFRRAKIHELLADGSLGRFLRDLAASPAPEDSVGPTWSEVEGLVAGALAGERPEALQRVRRAFEIARRR